MKKVVSLLLVLACCLSLCACGEKVTNPSNEGILNEASAINLKVVAEAFKDNEVNAQDTYFNKYYTIVGTVKEIDRNGIIINPIDAVFGATFSSPSKCYVELPVNEIKTLSTSDVIKVCGKLTDFEKGYDYYNLTLNDAFYVDDTIEITAEISDISNYSDGRKSIVLKQYISNGTSGGYLFYNITVAQSGAENSEEAEYNGTTYQIGDSVTFTGTLRNDSDIGSNYYNVVTLNTIAKN